MNIIADCHTHTILSGHAYSTLIENVEEAKKRGLKIIASTDHGPQMPGACHYFGLINQGARSAIINGVHVLKGVEANILNVEGDIDIEDSLLKRFEFVAAGFHEPVLQPVNKDVHTEGYLNMIKKNRVDMITHCGNPSFDFDFETVLKAAVEANIAVEINDSSFNHSRKGSHDRCLNIAKIMANLGGLVFVNSDAHFSASIGKFDDALKVIKDAGLKEEQIVNADVDRLYDFLIKKRGRTVNERVY